MTRQQRDFVETLSNIVIIRSLITGDIVVTVKSDSMLTIYEVSPYGKIISKIMREE